MACRTFWLLAVFLCSISAPGSSAAADAKAGKGLHDASCLRCHGTDVYTSPKRKITSREVLDKQVARCAEAAGASWTKDQMADVAEYLNGAFYRFK